MLSEVKCPFRLTGDRHSALHAQDHNNFHMKVLALLKQKGSSKVMEPSLERDPSHLAWVDLGERRMPNSVAMGNHFSERDQRDPSCGLRSVTVAASETLRALLAYESSFTYGALDP